MIDFLYCFVVHRINRPRNHSDGRSWMSPVLVLRLSVGLVGARVLSSICLHLVLQFFLNLLLQCSDGSLALFLTPLLELLSLLWA